MKDELERRISAALDAPGGLEADADLRALLSEDAEARAYAQELVRIDAVLRSFGERVREPDWEALAASIEARLDTPLDGELAIDAPPFPDEAPADRRASAVSQEVPVAPTAAAAPMPAAPMFAAPMSAAPMSAPSAGSSAAAVVDLAARRQRRGALYWMGGLAAAAAVGLGITLGVTTLGGEAEPMAAAPAMERADTVAEQMGPMPPPAPAASAMSAEPEPEPALPAAAEASPRVVVAQEVELPARPAARVGEVLDPWAASEPSARAERARTRLPRRASRGAETAALRDHRADRAARPTRAQVLAAIRSAERSVQRCIAERGEVARVSLQVGADGRVMSVRVGPPYTGADAQCIVDAVRRVRLPASAEDYQMVHTFRPAPMAGGSLAHPPAAARRARPPAAAPHQDALER